MTTSPIASEGAFVDLHLHSTASDGTDTPAEVVRTAHGAGLAALALTDHDTVDGIAEAQETARSLGIRLVPGVELSVYEGTTEMHLLGLHLEDLDEMDRHLAVYRSARRTRAEEIVRRLNDIGVRITMDDVLAAARDGAIGRPHVARALVENGWAMDLRDAFARYLAEGRPGYLDKRRMSIEEALGLVHRCGGIVVYAHPGSDGTNERLAELAARGLDGVEVLHPSHGAD
ncbi:MAG TPA: PHP domain-containing protein, partial [Gemmatimonadaceae bacterium]